MTTLTARPGSPPDTPPEVHIEAGRRLSRSQVALVAVAALAVSAGLFALTGLQGVVDFVVFAALACIVAVTAISGLVEGRRRSVDRLATTLVFTAFVLAMIPLVLVLAYTIIRGLKRFNLYFLTHSMAGVGPLDATGGVYHALIGTLEQIAIATLISVPLGLMVAIYVTEYGTHRLASSTRFIVDVMTGIPSIVAGLFVFSFWVLALGQGFSGFAAAIALSILMLPTVIRSSEEMIKLVPDSLREASYALGIAKWKTIVRIVLPTAATGITTGVMLAVARVAGETAPLLMTSFGSDYINTNPFSGPQSSLALFVYQQASSSYQTAIDRAWAGALVLILLVLVLYVSARLLTRRNKLTN